MNHFNLDRFSQQSNTRELMLVIVLFILLVILLLYVLI